MSLLVIGKTGQLARAIAELDPEATCLDRQTCDLSGTKDSLREALRDHLPNASAMIIAAAYTAVDQAETDQDTAHHVNALAPASLAELAAEHDIPVVHISTDYVFNGQAIAPYAPDDPTAPINVYGQTKRDGETGVRAANPRSAILRTSWVYDASGKNFMTTMLRLGQTRETLTVVADQIGRPTFAPDLARAAIQAATHLKSRNPGSEGIFHVSNSGEPISWADFARTIFKGAESFGASPVTVTDIPSRDYPTPAARPAYSVMDITPFEIAFGMALPDWKDGLSRALKQHFAHASS